MKLESRLSIALLATCPALCAGQVYSVTKLDKPRSGSIGGYFINDAGSIVLQWAGKQQWLRKRDGSMTFLVPPPELFSTEATCLSESDDVVANGTRISNQQHAAVLYSHGQPGTILNTPFNYPQGDVLGINERGQIVGQCGDGQIGVATLWNSDGTIENLGSLTGYGAFSGYAINSHEIVVGHSGDIRGDRAVIWRRGFGWTDMGNPPGIISVYAQFVNDDGTAVGSGVYRDLIGQVVVFEQNKNPYVVPGPNDTDGFNSLGMNNHGDVGGYVFYGPGARKNRAALWLYGWPRAKFLSDVLDSTGAGWWPSAIAGPNNKGQFTGGGWADGATTTDALLITPHSYSLPPASLNIKIGKLDHGSLASLGSADDDVLGIRRFFVPTISSPVVSIRVSTKTAIDTMYIWLKLTARANGPAEMKVSLWDVKAKAWDVDYPLQTSLGTAFSYSECIAKRRMEWYMDADTTVRAKIDVTPVSFDPNFMVEFDQASFEYVPASA